MIHSNILNNDFYKTLDCKIALCLEKSKEFNENTPIGRQDLGEGCFVNVSEYQPKDIQDAIFETHSKYADIQMILDGEEYIGYNKTTLLSPECAYDSEKDIRFWQGEISLLAMQKGDWVLFMPEEAHAPGLKYNSKSVKKAVFKIPY